MALPSDLCKKPFGYCTVKWQIDNFSLQIINTKNWLIQSPEFIISGSEDTSWLMTLKPILTKSPCILFNLKRSFTDSGSKYIWLNLRVHCTISGVTYVSLNETLRVLKKGSNYKACFGSVDSLLTETKRSDGEFFIICHMIVYNNNASVAFRECNQEGLNLLSKNMLDLYRSARHFDTKLMFDDQVILTHKAILWARNEYLRFLLEEEENDDEDLEIYEFEECTIMDFSDVLDYKGMKKILAYLYSGDIKHVLEEPSFAIKDCAFFLDMSEVEIYYEPDELTLKSTIDVEEYSYTLCGYQFKKSCLIWRLDEKESMKTFQLFFYPNKNSEDFIQLFTKSSQKIINACLKLDFVYRNVTLCSIHLIVDGEFIDMNEKIGRHLKNLTFFDVVVNLKVTTGIKTSSIDKYNTVFVSRINKDKYYETLSMDMEFLFDGGPFTDTLIDNNGIHFWVHKCVLASRSKMFSDLLLINEEGEEVHMNFDPHVVSVILTYIYSGLLLDVSDEEVIDVYKAAVVSNLPQLKSMSSKSLEEVFKTNKSLRCRIVRVAELNDDSLLMKSVLNHLFDRKDAFSMTYHPFSFQDVQACRHCLPTS